MNKKMNNEENRLNEHYNGEKKMAEMGPLFERTPVGNCKGGL